MIPNNQFMLRVGIHKNDAGAANATTATISTITAMYVFIKEMIRIVLYYLVTKIQKLTFLQFSDFKFVLSPRFNTFVLIRKSDE